MCKKQRPKFELHKSHDPISSVVDFHVIINDCMEPISRHCITCACWVLIYVFELSAESRLAIDRKSSSEASDLVESWDEANIDNDLPWLTLGKHLRKRFRTNIIIVWKCKFLKVATSQVISSCIELHHLMLSWCWARGSKVRERGRGQTERT